MSLHLRIQYLIPPVFHNYRLEGSFITGNADFYIDNVLTANITLLNGVTDNATNGLAFGDLTGYTNTLAGITSYSFTQSAIPEPSSILGLLTFGILGIGKALKRTPNQ